MAQLTPTIPTALSSFAKTYRKMQGALVRAINTESEEWGVFKDVPEYKITISGREMTIPADLYNAGSSAMIPEGGLEANPTSPGLEELTISFANLNARMAATLTAKYLDRKSRAGQVIRQLRFQWLKKLEEITNTVGWQFYGFSTGVKCQTTTVATQASGVYVLANAFGVSGLGNAAYLASMFAPNLDRVALIRAGALVANAIGQITAVDTVNGTITVTWNGSVTSASGDNIVMANSVENTTILGTDWNLCPVGLLDASLSTSVHGLSGASVPNWNPAFTSAVAGRFTNLKLRKGNQAMMNTGNVKGAWLIQSQGVMNDWVEGERALVRYDGPLNMETDGSIRTKGITQFQSRRVPPGCAWLIGKDAVGKIMITDLPDEETPAWESADKMENRNAVQFSTDLAYGYVWEARRKIVFWQNQTEQ
jgi:hypothetical protein